MFTRLIALLLLPLLTACQGTLQDLSGVRDQTSLQDLSGIPDTYEEQLPFTCTHEKDRIPPRNPEANQLYEYAKWMQQKEATMMATFLNLPKGGHPKWNLSGYTRSPLSGGTTKQSMR